MVTNATKKPNPVPAIPAEKEAPKKRKTSKDPK